MALSDFFCLFLRCRRLNLQPLAYLWHWNQEILLKEMISSNVQAIIIKVAAFGMYSDSEQYCLLKFPMDKSTAWQRKTEPLLHILRYEMLISRKLYKMAQYQQCSDVWIINLTGCNSFLKGTWKSWKAVLPNIVIKFLSYLFCSGFVLICSKDACIIQ